MGRYDFSKPRFEMLAKNMPFHALLDAVGAGAEAEKKQTKTARYRIKFKAVNVEADSLDDALTLAAKEISDDPSYYTVSVVEGNHESWVSA